MSSLNLWAAVPTVEELEDFRTINPYRTHGPAGDAGESWGDYFRRLRAERQAGTAEAEEEDEAGELVITQEAEEFDEPCRSLASYWKLAHANGWKLHTMAHALSFERGKLFKSGEREGQRGEDKHFDLQWIFIEKEGEGRAVIAYLLDNGKTVGTMTHRSFNGRRLSDADMKAAIKS